MHEGIGNDPESEKNQLPNLKLESWPSELGELKPLSEQPGPPVFPPAPRLEVAADQDKLLPWFDEIRQWKPKPEIAAPEPPEVSSDVDAVRLKQFKVELEHWKLAKLARANAPRTPTPSMDLVVGTGGTVDQEAYVGERPAVPESPETPHIGAVAGEAPEPPRVSLPEDEPALEAWYEQVDLWKRGKIDTLPDPPELTTQYNTQKYKIWKLQLEQWMQTMRSEAPINPQTIGVERSTDSPAPPELDEATEELQGWFDRVEAWKHTGVTEAPPPPQMKTQADQDKVQHWLSELEDWKRNYLRWERANIGRQFKTTAAVTVPGFEEAGLAGGRPVVEPEPKVSPAPGSEAGYSAALLPESERPAVPPLAPSRRVETTQPAAPDEAAQSQPVKREDDEHELAA